MSAVHFLFEYLLAELLHDIETAHPNFDSDEYTRTFKDTHLPSSLDPAEFLTPWITMVHNFLVHAIRKEVGEEWAAQLTFTDLLLIESNGFLEYFSGRIYTVSVVSAKIKHCCDIIDAASSTMGFSKGNALSSTFSRAMGDLDSLISRIRILDYARIADSHLEAIRSSRPPSTEAILGGPDVAQQVNTVQDALDNNDTELTPNARKVLLKFLYKAAKTRGVLPKRFYVQGVRKEGEHPFGGGSFGDVYKGRIDERKVAVKVCRFFWKADTKEQKYGEIYKEAFIWKPLDHPNVLPFLGICTDGFPSVGLVSPFMDNGNLMNYMKRKPNIDRLDFAEQICLGLAYLHSKEPEVVHGDLKCANILVDDDGRPRIADFGLARAINISSATTSTKTKGTFRWQAPELVYPGIHGGEGRVNAKTDVYAFGMTCLEIYTGGIPFHDQTDWEVATMARDGATLQHALELTEDCTWISEILRRCCTTKPDSRLRAADVFRNH